MIIAFNTIVQNIVKEVEKFDELEQQAILAMLRARNFKKTDLGPFVKRKARISMETIDAIKHKSRRNAGK
ncbi:MAG: hypothetical protein JST90_01875 [Bacteroidetes bacterium]|nr:hypothetical protein [Bacteroidota bacterium]